MMRHHFLVPFLSLLLLPGTALVVGACDDDDEGEHGTFGHDTGDHGTSNGDGQSNDDDGCPDDGQDTSDCEAYMTCIDEMCGSCVDPCSEFLSCAGACDCGDTDCTTQCFEDADPECTSCLTEQATCAASRCSEELMSCG